MLFNSFEFLLFLPIVFLLYWFVFKRLKWQNLFLVVASYVFYGWWDWRFLILIALTTLFSYVSGRLIARYEGQQKRQKALSAINIVLNLSILGVFKYYNFFAENFAALFGNIGWQIDWVTLDILLPVGISFYTFQALSYSIDVYQKKLPVCKDIIAFFCLHQLLSTVGSRADRTRHQPVATVLQVAYFQLCASRGWLPTDTLGILQEDGSGGQLRYRC